MPEVSYIGSIESGNGFENNSIFVKFNLIFSNESSSSLVSGSTSGTSWLGTRTSTHSNNLFGLSSLLPSSWKNSSQNNLALLNFPMSFTFSFNSFAHWPQILIQVFSVDSYSRVDSEGYGIIRLPATAGEHTFGIPITRPIHPLPNIHQPIINQNENENVNSALRESQPQSTRNQTNTCWERLSIKFLGGNLQYKNPSALVNSSSRFAQRTESRGFIYIRLNTILKGINNNTLLKQIIDVGIRTHRCIEVDDGENNEKNNFICLGQGAKVPGVSFEGYGKGGDDNFINNYEEGGSEGFSEGEGSSGFSVGFSSSLGNSNSTNFSFCRNCKPNHLQLQAHLLDDDYYDNDHDELAQPDNQ